MKIARALASVAILSGALLARTNPELPRVNMVQPSGWQMGANDEIVLRLSGEHLDGVVGVKVKHKGIRVVQMQPQDGNHLLVKLRISQKAEPGTVMLQVYTQYMTTFAALPMMETGVATHSAPDGVVHPSSGELAAQE